MPFPRFLNFGGLFKHKMREAQLGAHTVRSHGMTLARTHMHDWIILVLLVILECILLIIHPFYRFVSKDMMTDLSFPLKSNTVPIWTVPIYAMLLPLVIFIAIYFRRRDVYDLHHAVLGLLYSVLVTAVLTDSIKNAVGRPRPDFFWRCFPDGKAVYDSLGDVICHGDKSVIREGHKSFPSGHTSWSFAGLGFLSLYLSGKIQAFDGKGHVAKLCIVILPLLVAALVGISRVDDYWHHWQDVFAGGLLGLVVSTFCYLQFFPPPYHTEAWGPYAYFQVLEAARAQAQAAENGVAQGGNGEEEDGGGVDMPFLSLVIVTHQVGDAVQAELSKVTIKNRDFFREASVRKRLPPGAEEGATSVLNRFHTQRELTGQLKKRRDGEEELGGAASLDDDFVRVDKEA
ncbi:putative lipid phosphate phosphatase 3, chloroplastic isoform X2 [Brassica rapa]|uniref:putative lipid phosphate phosphatase 3, chloroplastic isoform X2 n=1 Tax=Brassica campestris TaxID=3711 RepID=UPI00142D3188|nr:putative lipid phosphate phosphatase 3, chloroplastic isoform X2 [Brassica rapa]